MSSKRNTTNNSIELSKTNNGTFHYKSVQKLDNNSNIKENGYNYLLTGKEQNRKLI
jgi:hypothetical protein